MKRIVFIILSVLTTIASHGQVTEYRPVVEEEKEWLYIEVSHLFFYRRYYLEGDTIISNYTCKKLYYDEGWCENVNPNYVWWHTPHYGVYCGAILQERKETYLYQPGENYRRKLYDFGIQLDSVLTDVTGQPMRVTGEEQVKDSASHVIRKLTLEGIISSEARPPIASWLEGIGCTYDLLNSGPIYPGGNHWCLYRCDKHDECIYIDTSVEEALSQNGIGLPSKVLSIRDNHPELDNPTLIDLMGRKVNTVKSGIYIRNGKKVAIK
jgi:hypothetical protein